MKIYNVLLLGLICVLMFISSLSRAETADEKEKVSARELWKYVIVDKSRKYDELISIAKKIISENNGKPAALTAELLMGYIEIDRALNDLEETWDKARAVFVKLAQNNPQSWQGQAAKISLINMLHLEGKHSEVITESLKSLKEINWDLLGKDAPQDLADYKKMAGADAEFTPDVLRLFLAKNYFCLKKVDDAKQWALKIENADMKRETEEVIKSH